MTVKPSGPREFEPEWLQRSLDRHLTWGLVFMAVLIVAFPIYRSREDSLRRDATREQQTNYIAARHGRVQTELLDMPWPAGHRRQHRADPQLEAVPLLSDRRPDAADRLHRGAGNFDDRLGPGVRRPTHLAADP